MTYFKVKTNFLRCIGYLSFTNDRIRLDQLQILVLLLPLSILNCSSCLTAIESHVIRYSEAVYETSNKTGIGQ